MGHPHFWLSGLCLQPTCFVVLLFKRVERGFVTQRKTNVVEAFEQAELAEGIDFKGCAEAAAVGYGLCFKGDC